MNTDIAKNLIVVNEKITFAANKAGRSHKEITLVTVSKTWPTEIVAQAEAAGATVFGENKVQEGEIKIPALKPENRWHLIGHLQKNKVRKAVSLFDVIETVDSLSLATRIDRIANELEKTQEILLQVNIGNEAQKSGFSTESIEEAFPQLLELPHLNILGLMAITPATTTPEATRPHFAALRLLRDHLSEQHSIALPHLSMGMSSDYPLAIEEGATLVRVGSAIFGPRDYAK